MLTFEIAGEDVKRLMNQLLKGNMYDRFEVRGMEICAVTRFEVSGILDKAFISEEPESVHRNYCRWEELRPYAFELIKGNKKPKSIKIIFSLPDEAVKEFHENAAALFLNFAFENDVLSFTTATGQKNFSLDKSMELRWDEYIKKFFHTQDFSVSTRI